MPFGWLVYLLWFWFYDSQVKTALDTLVYSRHSLPFFPAFALFSLPPPPPLFAPAMQAMGWSVEHS